MVRNNTCLGIGMFPPEKTVQLQNQWIRLVGPFGVEPVAAYPVFDALVTAYSESHRFYHTLEHLSEMFRVSSRLADQCQNLTAVQLAIWFHDIVYDPRKSDNERRSAEVAIQLLTDLGLPSELIQTVAELVRHTDHKPREETPSPELAVLLDSDLAILGASETRYQRYAADIRREYEFVPEADYRAGRIRVLQSFLERDRIFLTHRMFEEGEAPARRNLAWEIVQLAGNV